MRRSRSSAGASGTAFTASSSALDRYPRPTPLSRGRSSVAGSPVGVEPELGQLAGSHLVVGTEGDGHLLVVPLHDVERQLQDLVDAEVLSGLLSQLGRDRAGKGHEGVGQSEGDLV